MKIETKYTPGDKLYSLYKDKVQEFTVEYIEASSSLNYNTMLPYEATCKYKLRIGESAGCRLEKYEFEIDKKFYRTKEELIKSL